MSIKRVANIYGAFTFFALILSIYTHPISVNDDMKLFFDKEIMLEPSEIKEFLIFIFISATLYFLAVNVYFSNIKDLQLKPLLSTFLKSKH